MGYYSGRYCGHGGNWGGCISGGNGRGGQFRVDQD